MKIAVIITKPSFHQYMVPLGYLYVVAALKKTGLPVEVFNVSSDSESEMSFLGKTLQDKEIDLLVTATSYKFHNNCPSSTIHIALEVTKLVKKQRPNCFTLLVGPLNAVLYNVLLRDDTVDAVALGESEEICIDVANALKVSH
jgi:hypothetical protein